MKKIIVLVINLLMISSLIIPTYALGNRIISIKDLRTNNAISNAYTTIFDIKSGKSYDYISDDNV